jgi:hypothetical protein
LPVSCWRITSPLYSDIAEFLNCPKASQKTGRRFGRDFALQLNQKPYINAGIFLDYIRIIFVPYIDTFRGLAVLTQEISILLLDDCSAHFSDDVVHILTEARCVS